MLRKKLPGLPPLTWSGVKMDYYLRSCPDQSCNAQEKLYTCARAHRCFVSPLQNISIAANCNKIATMNFCRKSVYPTKKHTHLSIEMFQLRSHNIQKANRKMLRAYKFTSFHKEVGQNVMHFREDSSGSQMHTTLFKTFFFQVTDAK